MIESIRRLLMALVVGLTMACAGPALAQSPEAEQLALKLAQEMMGAIDFKAAVMKGARESAGLASMDEYRPNWSTLTVQALEEVILSSGPMMEKVVGRRFATLYSLEELKAGQVIMSDPAIKAMMAAASRGEDVDTNVRCGRECTRAMSSRAGMNFLRKLESATDKDVQGDIIAAIIPDFLRRLADKIEAAERARAR